MQPDTSEVMVVHGGRYASGPKDTNLTWHFDFATRTWWKTPTGKGLRALAREDHAAAAVGLFKMAVVGGLSDGVPLHRLDYVDAKVAATVWVLDLRQQAWTALMSNADDFLLNIYGALAVSALVPGTNSTDVSLVVFGGKDSETGTNLRTTFRFIYGCNAGEWDNEETVEIKGGSSPRRDL